MSTSTATTDAVRSTSRTAWWIAIGVVVLIGALVLGVMIGPAGRISAANWNIVWSIRMPRVALAALVGAMLSLAGASYQGVFRNPLVDPYLLGVAAGAGLAATLVIAYGGASGQLVPPPAFAGAALSVALASGLGRSAGRTRAPTSPVLA